MKASTAGAACVALCALGVQARAAVAAPTGVVPADVRSYEAFAGLAVAPDGGTVAYVLETPNAAGDGYEHAIYVRGVADGAVARRVSGPDAFDDQPAFSPDGRYLAFLSDDGDGAQVKVVRLGKTPSKPRAATDLAWGVGEFAWAPDSARLVVVSWRGEEATRRRRAARRERARAEERVVEKPAAAPGDDADASAPIVLERTLLRRDGEGWLQSERSHLWIVGRDGGPARQLTTGAFDDGEPRWSPTGDWIAFTSNRAPDPDLTDDTDVYLVHPDGSGLRRFAGAPGPDSRPSWSPDGARLAWLSAARPNDYYLTVHLMVHDLAGVGAARDLTGGLDTWVAEDWVQASDARAEALWSADGGTLFVPLERRGTTYLAALPADGGPPRELHAGRFTLDFVRGAVVAGGERLVFGQGDPTHPSELYVLDPGAPPRRLTRLHDAWMAQRRLVAPERVQAISADGAAVEAWAYPPLERAAARQYPLVVYVHGGPQAFDGEFFDEGLENQVLPAAGIGVLRVNYRGSTSYGEAFSAAIRSDWNRRELEDVLAALDAAAKLPWVDARRVGIGGWSYGGIVTLWAVGHSDRFRAAAPERFSADYLSAFGQDQWVAQYLAELGDPVEHEELYRRLSPIAGAAAIKVPLLMIAGEDDYNCPLPQALEMYQRLKVRGGDVRLVVYPGESHTFARPDHLEDRLERLVRWFTARL